MTPDPIEARLRAVPLKVVKRPNAGPPSYEPDYPALAAEVRGMVKEGHREAIHDLGGHGATLQSRLDAAREDTNVAWSHCKEEQDRRLILGKEIERLRGEREQLQQQAEIWAQEARTQKATVHEIYQLVTGGRGEPGNWNGAEPVRRELERLRGALEGLLRQTLYCPECHIRWKFAWQGPRHPARRAGGGMSP